MAAENKSIRLLLVDDEEDFLLATSQALERRGFEVSVAPNGVTALEKISKEVFDAVVLDVKMPDINGIDVFNQIRDRVPGMPVILLTGHPSLSDAFRTSKDGIADYISKPVEMDDLAGKVRSAIARVGKKADREKELDNAPDTAAPVSVMIVDDEPDLLSSLEKVLARRNITPVTADSGARALDMLKEKIVEVMVLDVKMPGMDGMEVLRRVKERYPSIQVILLSGHPSVEAALEGVRLGASEYLKKPPDIDELVATIRRLCEDRREILERQQAKLIKDIKRRYPE